jgi:hypothetical protein
MRGSAALACLVALAAAPGASAGELRRAFGAAPGEIPLACKAPENTTEFEMWIDLVREGGRTRIEAIEVSALEFGAALWEAPVRRGGAELTLTAFRDDPPFLAAEFASIDGSVTLRLAEFPGGDGPFFAGLLQIGSGPVWTGDVARGTETTGRWTVECYPATPVAIGNGQ